jgi:hypothetical protein
MPVSEETSCHGMAVRARDRARGKTSGLLGVLGRGGLAGQVSGQFPAGGAGVVADLGGEFASELGGLGRVAMAGSPAWPRSSYRRIYVRSTPDAVAERASSIDDLGRQIAELSEMCSAESARREVRLRSCGCGNARIA